jgi:hypothetical protein
VGGVLCKLQRLNRIGMLHPVLDAKLAGELLQHPTHRQWLLFHYLQSEMLAGHAASRFSHLGISAITDDGYKLQVRE